VTGFPKVATFGNQKVAKKIIQKGIDKALRETRFPLDNPAKTLLINPKKTRFMVSQCHFHVFFNSLKVFSFLDIFKNVQIWETPYNMRKNRRVV